MEIHHHPHIEKKSFKEYLLEGLMIFLAVTMGFIAENIREDIGDRSKEREYIVGIKKDLEVDTATLNVWLPAMQGTINDMDTLIALLSNPVNNERTSDLYYLARLSTQRKLFEASDNTLIDLKSSGNFRLIRHKRVVNTLINFEKLNGRYFALNEVANHEAEFIYPLIGKLFDAKVFLKMTQEPIQNGISIEQYLAEGGKKSFQKPEGNPQLRNSNSELINELIYYESQRRQSFNGELKILISQKIAAIKLIELLNKEYHLGNE